MPQLDRSKVALAPDLRDLDGRAVRAWTERMEVRPLGGGVYTVESEGGRTYSVDLPGHRCTCPDHRYRGVQCKHLRRIALEITQGRVPPPGKREAACAVCGRDAFVPETAEPPLCDDCRLEAGDVVADRETGDRLVVQRVIDERADEYAVPGVERTLDGYGTGGPGDAARAETTVAAYPTNEGYPADDLVVEVVYLAAASRQDDPRTYAFPYSRLDPVDDATVLD